MDQQSGSNGRGGGLILLLLLLCVVLMMMSGGDTSTTSTNKSFSVEGNKILSDVNPQVNLFSTVYNNFFTAPNTGNTDNSVINVPVDVNGDYAQIQPLLFADGSIRCWDSSVGYTVEACKGLTIESTPSP